MDLRRTERINLRLDQATNALLRDAAAAEGLSLTAFLLDAARDRARRRATHRLTSPTGPPEQRTHVDV